MRIYLCGMVFAGLVACSPSLPESGAGAGLDDAGTGAPLPAPAPVTAQQLEPAGADMAAADGINGSDADDGSDTDDVAAQAMAAIGETGAQDADAAAERAANSGEPVLHADPDNAAPELLDNPGISDENDFEAVDDRRSIENDAELIARNRELYKVIDPEALPKRPGGTGPNIVQYALRTQHPKGTQIYRRVGFNKEKRFRRNCARYASADLAQIAFLERGGPERDRMGLDPDGDGFACGWDPDPFRKAVSG